MHLWDDPSRNDRIVSMWRRRDAKQAAVTALLRFLQALHAPKHGKLMR